jgi:hypothetical protein
MGPDHAPPMLYPDEIVVRRVLKRSVRMAEYEEMYRHYMEDYNANWLECGMHTSEHHWANLQVRQVEGHPPDLPSGALRHRGHPPDLPSRALRHRGALR